MRNTINIKGNDQVFTYLLEYNKQETYSNIINTIKWCKCDIIKDCVHLFEDDVKYFRHNNDWYSTSTLTRLTSNIPNNTKLSKIRVYIPNHSVATYVRNANYVITANTWINGYKVDLGSFIFKSNETLASSGPIYAGNNEYNEYIEFYIIDPFHVVYSDDWADFRKNICKEPDRLNDTGSILNVSIHIVDNLSNMYEERYTINPDYLGCASGFDISNGNDFLSIDLKESTEPGLTLSFNMNSEYNWLLSYLYDTYNISTNYHNIYYEIIIKNKDTGLVGPRYLMSPYQTYEIETTGKVSETYKLSTLMKNSMIKEFFNDWNTYEEGWSFVGSFLVLNKEGEEIFSTVSNELPITQELFSRFYKGETKKIIDLTDMVINQYNVVNKIKNEIVQIERPTESKTNILQQVFYKVNDAEMIAIHPTVTENICVNLSDYLTVTDSFVLQVEGCRFEQIGVNSYGVIFKLGANVLPCKTTTGTYYILDENMELITTGKYKYIL